MASLAAPRLEREQMVGKALDQMKDAAWGNFAGVVGNSMAMSNRGAASYTTASAISN